MMQELYQGYAEAQHEYEREHKRRVKLIQRHQKALDKLERKPLGWIENVLTPMAEAISKAIEMPYEVYGPFGLSSETSIYFFVNGKKGSITKEPTLSLTLYPEWQYEGTKLETFTLWYDTGERDEKYPPHSLGELNAGNKRKAPLPDGLDSVVELLRRSN